MSEPAGKEQLFFFEYGGEMIAIGDAEVRIGSAPDADIVVSGDKVEALTAVARRSGGRVLLESRANENEAKVNGSMLSLAELSPGGRVKIGDLDFRVTGEGTALTLEGDAGTFPLKIGANLVGRAPEAGVLIDHPSVSRKHALVMVMPSGQARIRDLGSSNGTEVEGDRLGVAELKHGDKVEVGGQTLIFLAGPAPEASAGADQPSEAVSVAPSSPSPPSLHLGAAPTVIGSSLDLPERVDAMPESPAAPTFELIIPGQSSRQLAAGETVIGRVPECDVALPEDDQASRRHASITIAGPDAKLNDLGSSNGTRLNGQPVRGEVVLADGDVIGVGNTEMEIQIARPVDPRGATVLAPGGLSIPPAPSAGGRAGGHRGQRGTGAPAGAAALGAAALGAAGAQASHAEMSNSGSSNAGAGGIIVDHASARATLDLAPGAGPDQIRQRYQELYSEYQIRLTNAPTPDLKQRYTRRLDELRSAHAILMPEDAGLSGDLPASRPVDAPMPGPAYAGVAGAAAAGAAAGAGGVAAVAPAGPTGAAAGATASAPPPPPEVGVRPTPAVPAASGQPATPPIPAAPPVGSAGVAEGGEAKAKSGGLPKSTWIMAAIVLALTAAILAFGYLYLGAAEVEQGLRNDLAQRQTDLANMRERIPQAGRELEDLVAGKATQLENQELKICNLGAGEMRIDWLHATYVTEDGSFGSFNSANHGWKVWQIGPAGSGKFNFVSGDRVLWDGTAVFFSVLFTYRGEEYFRSGPVTELGPDCYNIDLDQ